MFGPPKAKIVDHKTNKELGSLYLWCPYVKGDILVTDDMGSFKVVGMRHEVGPMKPSRGSVTSAYRRGLLDGIEILVHQI